MATGPERKYQRDQRWSLSSTFHCYLHTSFLSVRPVVLCSLSECTTTCSVVCPIWGTCAITYFKDSCKHWTLKQQFREGMGGRDGEGERGGRERERKSFLLLQWLPLQWLVFWDLVFTPIQFPPRLLVPVPPPLPFFLFYCFSLLYCRLSDQHWLLLFSAPILVRWICKMFYCLICWLYAHTCITEWCMHCLHPALWTRKVWFRSSCAPCILFHVLNLTHSFMPICI